MFDHNQQKNKKRFGSALEHGKAHERDHSNFSRRSFLKNLGIAGSASMVLGHLPLTAFGASPLAMALNNGPSDRILILIRLKGGNDGLNTIIPLYDYDNYRNLRPGIGIVESDYTKLTDEFAIPNTLNDFYPMWQEGMMKVVNSVGYPNQNLSHFRSSDIWASASDADVNDTSGWLGRHLSNQYPDFLENPPEIPPAIQIGGIGNLAFNNMDNNSMAVNVDDPEQLFEIAQNGQLYDTINLPDCHFGEQLGYIRSVTNNTFKYAEIIKKAYDEGANSVQYSGQLGEQLGLIARLIKGRLGTKFYMVSLDGFDTHANQSFSHPQLMLQLSNSISQFYQDIGIGGFDKDVLCMTISEFGRRIEQNASGGTDHGAASPLMLFGEGLNGNGFLGTPPDLYDLDDADNLKYKTDFRSIYASILENWLCVDGQVVDDVLGQSFERMDLGLNCLPTSTSSAPVYTQLTHQALYSQNGQVRIRYDLPESGPVKVRIFNMLGQPMNTLQDGFQGAGTQEVIFKAPQATLAAGMYVYRIEAGNRVGSAKIVAAH